MSQNLQRRIARLERRAPAPPTPATRFDALLNRLLGFPPETPDAFSHLLWGLELEQVEVLEQALHTSNTRGYHDDDRHEDDAYMAVVADLCGKIISKEKGTRYVF